MSYIELCRKAVESALKAGASEAEAFLMRKRSIGVEIERAEIKTAADLKDAGIAVRVAKEGKIGFAYTNNLTEEHVARIALEARKACEASRKDKSWKQLPEAKTYPTVRGTYDMRITRFTPAEAVAMCQRMMAAAVKVDKRVLPAFGGVEVLTEEMACVNSHGVEVEDRGTALICYLGTMARSETQISPICVEFKASRTFAPEPDWIGSEADKLAIQSIKVGGAEAGRFPVLLDPFALEEILTYTLIRAVGGDNVSRGNSILKDKVGEKVAGENVSIYDDGTLQGGLQSGSADTEGVPKQKTPIIQDGILDGFLYDNYWAKMEGKESTGNGSRGGGRLSLPPYGTLPAIKPSNIIFKAGTASEDELIEEVKNGYYVRSVQGAHQSNPETGEFSVALAPAWRILQGKITHAVKGVMIAGNIYEMLEKIALVGEKTRQLSNLIAPKIVVSELNVVAK